MNYLKILLAAIVATAVMTGFVLAAPLIGLPQTKIAVLLGAMFHGNLIAGWVMHFVIGILFVIPYALLFNKWLPVENKVARGAIYGIVVFVFSEIIFALINILGYLTWDNKESMALMIFVNILSCLIYGMVLGAFFDRAGKDGMEKAKHQ